MKKPVVICSSGLLLATMIYATGCISGPSVADEKKADQSTEPVDGRGFDPLELPRDSFIVPVRNPKAGTVTGKQVLVAAETGETGPDTSYLSVDDFPETVDTLASQAYRVQIFTSKLFGEARQAARIAEEIFDRPVFVDYEVPYFKVRVGSFETREKAETYQQKVKAVGYANAWVVIVNIDIKRAADLYGEPFESPLVPDTVLQEDEEL